MMVCVNVQMTSQSFWTPLQRCLLIRHPSMIDMSHVSSGKNIAVGEASAFGASETHEISVFPHPFAPCRIA